MASSPLPMPPLALTMGEPAGIGPELALKVWQDREITPIPPFVLVAGRNQMSHSASALGSSVPLKQVASPAEAVTVFEDALPLLAIEPDTRVDFGHLDPSAAEGVIRSIEIATKLALSGDVSAVVTNPIHKKNLYESGFSFPGHTEFLAHLAHKGKKGPAPLPVMMLAGGGLRAVPVTIHIPLKDVPEALTTELLISTAQIIHSDLIKRFGIKSPRQVAAGLNPHAGEGGALGHEDMTIITPAINALISQGLNIRGPLSADTLFHEKARKTYDVALCMYHDQALIPVKTLGFDEGVNITLGLSFIRTSPDHGTALDIAGTGKADPQSLVEALKTAAKMAEYTAQYALRNEQ